MSSDGIEVVDAVHARTTSREDRILSAKKKLSKYRKAQRRSSAQSSNSSSATQVVTCSSPAAKRTSFIAAAVPPSPLRHSRKPSSNAAATVSISQHAHRRSRSRISVSMPSSKHHAPSSTAVARLSALLAFEHNATGGGNYPSVDQGKLPQQQQQQQQQQQRQSGPAGQDTLFCPPTPSSSAPTTSAQISTPKSPMRTRPAPASPSRQAAIVTPDRTYDNREQPVASTSKAVFPDISALPRQPQPQQSTTMQHSRRDSRRHSRNLSIVSVADVGGTVIASPFHASSPFVGSGRMPLTASSPVPSRQQAKLGSGFTFGNAGNYSTNKRQSGNVSSTSPFSAAPASRVLSPQHSPVLHQSTMSASPYPSYSSSRLYATHAFGFSPSYAPVASTSASAATPVRRASLQMQQSQPFSAQRSPAFPSSAQRMQSEPGVSFGAYSMQATPSNVPTSSMQGTPLTASHGRRPSRHTRRISVATRRESMEIMSGIPSMAGGSPDPNMSATAAFLASTVSDQGFAASNGMSRSSTWTSLGDGVQEERQLELQTPSHPAAASAYLSPRPFASGMRRTLSQEEELERASALSALEGRISSKSETIELPAQTALDAFAESLAARTSPPTSSHANSAVSPSPLKAFEQRRGSWQSGLAVSPAVLHNTGGRGATDLGMLVEEEEDVESEATMNTRPSSSSSSSDNDSTISPLKASSGSRQSLTSLSNASTMRKSRPASLIFPSSRALPFAARPALSPHSADTTISPLKQLPRSLSLSTSATSLTSPASSAADGTSARRTSGLKSLTLASSQAAASESPLTGRRTSLLSERASQASPSHSFRDSNTRVRKMSNGSVHASTPSKTATSGQRNSLTAQSARTSIPSPAPASAHRDSITAFSFNPSVFADRRDSELSVNSTFGGLVMEEGPMEDSFTSQDTNVEDSTSMERLGTERLNITERPALSRSTSSEDPVILSMQVQALRQRLEHQSAEHLREVAVLRATHTAATDELQASLSAAEQSAQLFQEERDSLREDNDDWRIRCKDLEGHLSAERRRLEDERKESHLLRDKVRKLGDRLAAQSTGQNGSTTNALDDQHHATAQAKLIAEMRDQIFSLAAALERERIKSAGGDSSRSSSPLLKALALKVADERASEDAREKQSASASRVLTHSPSPPRVSQLQHQHQPREGSSASMGSYSYSVSSKSGSNWSGYSSMGAAPGTEDTSVADDDSVFGTAKSPVSPFYPLSATSSFSLPSTLTPASISIAMHPLSMPLRRDDSVSQGGLGTLAEEDEESTEGSETVDLNTRVQITPEELDEAVYSTDDGEGTDYVPDLIPDEFRTRTQSTSTDSGDTNEQMPLTPCRETAAMPLPLPGPQARHHRSDSFIKHWSFPRGCVEQSAAEEHESFWALPSETLPALPVTPGAADVPPFSADISMNEDYFSESFQLHLKRLSAQAMQGPPASRSSEQSRQLSQDVRTTTSTAGSRLSLQGITSSIWNWRSSNSSPASAPASSKKTPMVLEQQRRVERQQRDSQFAPFESVSLTTPVASGLRRLLRLEPTPLSRLDFTHSCYCEGDSRIISV